MASIALLMAQYLVRGAAYVAHGHSTAAVWSHWYTFLVSLMGVRIWIDPEWKSGFGLQLLIMLVDIVVAWVLLALAIRRARTEGSSPLTACLAIVPIIQIPIIVWLAAPPLDASPSRGVRARVPLGVALKGLSVGLVLTVLLVAVSTLVLRSYGSGLFLASPFFVGCVTAYIGNRHADIGSAATFRLVLGACFLGAVGLMAVAIEGVVCLALASPIIAVMAGMGGLAGRAIARKRAGASGRVAMSFAVLPVLFAVDLIAPPNYAFESVESIEVAASKQDVWDAVVHMGPIPAPPPAPFRWGLAYPMSGTITGSGIGAIREGVFSTGVAYERVTEWEPGSRLSFVVLSDPPTMRELSPYQTVHAPHVIGYFRTLDARFTITPLANGHTRLSLATQHELDLSPAFYWSPMAKWAVHTNKVRVLAHFAQQAEATAAVEVNR